MIGSSFISDRFGIIFSILFVFVGAVSLLYALTTARKQRLGYYLTLVLILCACISGALSGNLMFIFVCWVLSIWAVWYAVGFFEEQRNTGGFASIATIGSALLLLIGILLLYGRNGTFTISGIRTYGLGASVCIIVGILAIVAVLPVRVLLSHRYQTEPFVLGGFLAGSVENLGLILFVRLFWNNHNLSPVLFTTTAWIAAASSIGFAIAALRAHNLRTLLACSMISQVSFVVVAVAIGGLYGVIGGMVYLMGHALAASGLFYGVDLIDNATGKHDLASLGAMYTASPTLGVLMALLCGSIIGVFPFVGFLSKLWVVIGVVQQSRALGIVTIVVMICTMVYMLRFYHELFFVRPEMQIPAAQKIGSTGIIIVCVLAAGSMALGVFFFHPVAYVTGATGL